MVPKKNIILNSSKTPMLTIDEVEKVEQKQAASLVGHVFQLTFAALCDKLVQEEKVNNCYGCAIDHPSQREHACLMIDSKEAWNYYHDKANQRIDLSNVMKTAQNICSTLGFNLGKSWEAYVSELPKIPWTTIYLTCLELDDVNDILQAKKVPEARICDTPRDFRE